LERRTNKIQNGIEKESQNRKKVFNFIQLDVQDLVLLGENIRPLAKVGSNGEP
jgi:hypothetical protein